MDYIDDYAACERTYATIRIYPGRNNPDEITKYLGLTPSNITYVNREKARHTVNGWFLSTKDQIVSKDSRKHIDYLLDRIQPLADKISRLRENGAKIDICCFWVSATGNGGPILSPKQMMRLADLGLDVWWDVWFSENAK